MDDDVKIKLLTDLEIKGVKYSTDFVMEVDADTAKELVEKGAAEEYSQKAADEELKIVIDKAVDEGVKAAIKTHPHFSVKDNSDEDPTYGYLEPKKEYTESELHYGLGQFCKDVYDARSPSGTNERLMKCQKRADNQVVKAAGDGQAVGRDADGGFTIPPAFNTMLLNASLEMAVVRPRATIIPIGTNVVDLPTVSDFDHSSETVFGGVQAFWKSEEAQLASSKAKFENIELKLKKLTALGFATTEMMRWSPISIGGWLLPKFAEAVAWKEDIAFISGSGAGEPLGIKNSGDYIEVPKETAQAANSILWLNIANMWAKNRGNDASQFFFSHKSAFPQLSNMTIGDSPAWSPANLAAGRPLMSLMGLALQWTEKNPVVGDAGDIVLATGSQYLIADDQAGPELAQSMHLKFDFDQTAFKVVKFVDGQPARRKVQTDLQGETFASNTAIAERA